jgi:site-specific DNA recombinase
MRLVGCVRVSRVAGRSGESFISPAQQRDRIEAHAAAHGHRIVGWQEDLDVSGTRMDRPGLEAAILAVEHGEADGLAVAKLDRFGRSIIGIAKGIDRLEKAGGVLVCVDVGLDTSTAPGRLMRNMLAVLAEFELDRIRENWKDASARAIGRGVHISRVPPFGYRRGDDGRLEPDPDTEAALAQIFEMRAAGESWKEIARFLDRAAPREHGVWPWQTVSTIVSRRTYLGEAFQGANVNVAAHEPLVGRDLWERAQPTFPRAPGRAGGMLLAGLIRCASCGYRMSQASDGARGYTNYKCRVRHAAGVCPEPSRISERRADSYVTERFLAWASDIAGRDRELTVASERLIATLEQTEAELAAYRDTTLVSVIGEHAFRQGLELRARRVEDARLGLRQQQRSAVPLIGNRNVSEEWPHLTVAERRELLTAGIDAVFVRRAHLPGRAPFEHRLFICWAGEAPADLPGRTVSGLRPFVFPVG